MGELLNQTLYLTVVGMGMTFLAIGALVASMYLMTAFIKDRKVEEEPLAPEDEPADVSAPESDERSLAAAVAVAVALATQSVATATAGGTASTADWSAYVRGQHLSMRQQYEARKRR